MRIARIVLLIAVVMVCGLNTLWADSASGTLFFTTFSPEPAASPQVGNFNVWSVSFNWTATNGAAPGTFTLGTRTGIALLGGADGILFLKNGNLAVGGQNGNNPPRDFEITTAGATVTSVEAGTGGYALALNATQTTLFNAWNGPGQGGTTALSRLDLSGTGGLSTNGTPLTVVCAASNPACSTDVRGITFDTANSTWYYGTAPDNGTGEFGSVAFSGNTATLTRLSTGVHAHDVVYDPFTGFIIANSGTTIEELVPATGLNPSGKDAIFFSGGKEYDNVDSDGLGHYFASSNTGEVTFIDLTNPLQNGIGDSAHVFSATQVLPFLHGNLDDVALQGGILSSTTTTTTTTTTTGSVPEPASVLLFGSAASIAMFLLRKRMKS